MNFWSLLFRDDDCPNAVPRTASSIQTPRCAQIEDHCRQPLEISGRVAGDCHQANVRPALTPPNTSSIIGTKSATSKVGTRSAQQSSMRENNSVWMVLALACGCTQMSPAGPMRTSGDDSFLGTFTCGQSGQICCAGQSGSPCMPGLLCQFGVCAAPSGQDGAVPELAAAACGQLGAPCCALADGSLRCLDTSMSCDGATSTCVPATPDEFGGDTFAANCAAEQRVTDRALSRSCRFREGQWCNGGSSGGLKCRDNGGTVSGCVPLRCQGGSNIMCCTERSSTASSSPSSSSPTPTNCSAERQYTDTGLSASCRYPLGAACNGTDGRRCRDNAGSISGCISHRCQGGSNIMCCTARSGGSTTSSSSSCESERRRTGSSLSSSCRYPLGASCNGGDGKTCRSTGGDSTGCVSGRCQGGSNTMCCPPR